MKNQNQNLSLYSFIFLLSSVLFSFSPTDSSSSAAIETSASPIHATLNKNQLPLPSLKNQVGLIKIIYTKGDVVTSPNGLNFNKVDKGQTLPLGHFLKTRGDSFAILSFNEFSKIKIKENSVFQLQDLSLTEKNKTPLNKVSFFVAVGGMLMDFVNKIPQKQWHVQVNTPLLSSSIRGTKFYVDTEFFSDDSPAQEIVAVESGVVQVTQLKDQKTLSVNANEAAKLDKNTQKFTLEKSPAFWKNISWDLSDPSSADQGPQAGLNSNPTAAAAENDIAYQLLKKACQSGKEDDACTFLAQESRDQKLLLDSCLKASDFACFVAGKWDTELKGSVLPVGSATLKALEEENKYFVQLDLQQLSAETLISECSDGNKYACMLYGKRSGNLLDAQSLQQIQDKTKYSAKIYFLLAPVCAENNSTICQFMRKLSPTEARKP